MSSAYFRQPFRIARKTATQPAARSRALGRHSIAQGYWSRQDTVAGIAADTDHDALREGTVAASISSST
jgi:hypothetical protein